ncbi:hypothetical protein HMPREF0239_04381, partial [Clostridium sp. ATCC BAA-442]
CLRQEIGQERTGNSQAATGWEARLPPVLWKSGPSLGISINHTAEGAAPPWRGWEPRRLWR